MNGSSDWAIGRFDVEHALGMYAQSYAVLPASGIYEIDKFKDELRGVPERSHIYVIGESPKLKIGPFEQDGRVLRITLNLANEVRTASFPLPPELNLEEQDGFYFLSDSKGQRLMPGHDQILSAAGTVPFKVLYIGQAFGKHGERKAIDRLLAHSRLQEIALKGVREGFELNLVLIELADTTLFTHFNPNAEIKDEEIARDRISAGVGKLFGTSLAERVSLYEAGLIRYFQPKFNVEFKNSFPSTNLKILADCYEKDFAAIVAEICIDDFPYSLYSESVDPKVFHIAAYDLQADKDRSFFFGLDEQA